MNPGVTGQVDEIGRLGYGSHRGVNDHDRRSDKSDHRAIVIYIHVPAQHDSPPHGFDRLRDLRDRFDLAALAEVWYTLNQLIFDF